MRLIVLAVLSLSTASIHAQGNLAPAEVPDPTPEVKLAFEHEDECGSPLVESTAWRSLDGTVIEVTGARTFIMRTSEGKRVHVDLVALETKDNHPPARELLSRLVQDQVVSVLVNPGSSGKKRVVGAVQVGTKDVSRELLQAGVARFKEPPPYSVSHYSSCLYRIAEREARKAKSGLWKQE
jgi:endonuclease YncB( thermonuclease family)